MPWCRMSPARFVECLILMCWTPINLASALQCERSWIEAMEAGAEPILDEPGSRRLLTFIRNCRRLEAFADDGQ